MVYNYLSYTTISKKNIYGSMVRVGPFGPKVQSLVFLLLLLFYFISFSKEKKGCNLWATS
jgi:hypothetical protein